MSTHIVIEFGNLQDEQRRVLTMYAIADYLQTRYADERYARIRQLAQQHLLEHGISPCYDDEDSCWTFMY